MSGNYTFRIIALKRTRIKSNISSVRCTQQKPVVSTGHSFLQAPAEPVSKNRDVRDRSR
ncbi:hypothetical protein D3C80_1916280 [compost metagenome]